MDIPKLMLKAYQIARLSDDPRTQNSALVIDHTDHVLSSSANVFPTGVRKCPERLERPEKYRFMAHAEEAALMSVAKTSSPLYRATLLSPWASCCPCARLIIQSGIKKVVVHKERMEMTVGQWVKETEIAREMLSEAGVEFIEWSGKVNGDGILIDGKVWIP